MKAINQNKGNVLIGLLIVIILILGGYVLFSGSNDNDESYSRTDNPHTTRSYEETGDRDCADFSTHAEAQEFFISEGGPDDDPHNLDRDGDGEACETLP